MYLNNGKLHRPSIVPNKNIHFWIDKKDIELIDLGKNPYGSSISFGQELSHALEDSSRTGFGLGPIVIPANPIMFLKGLEAKDCLSCLVAPVQRK
nr:hypothetical protein CFP56_21441 [Quercus suber]